MGNVNLLKEEKKRVERSGSQLLSPCIFLLLPNCNPLYKTTLKIHLPVAVVHSLSPPPKKVRQYKTIASGPGVKPAKKKKYTSKLENSSSSFSFEMGEKNTQWLGMIDFCLTAQNPLQMK